MATNERELMRPETLRAEPSPNGLLIHMNVDVGPVAFNFHKPSSMVVSDISTSELLEECTIPVKGCGLFASLNVLSCRERPGNQRHTDAMALASRVSPRGIHTCARQKRTQWDCNSCHPPSPLTARHASIRDCVWSNSPRAEAQGISAAKARNA